ncbi:BTAD domain-containing putative transcriptional regulator [Streptomyces sp. NPDC094466]|uniref:AfsR/SARP family transcriptional regulator n=1 Tax=Streptomyces sp. NPDC094466 TaxID=3366065 RepID=UPI003803BB78
MILERILVTLLLEPGRVLPVTRLVEAAWDEDPPATAAHQVRKAVADLRRRIPNGSRVLVTDGPGYRAVLDEDQLDLTEFGTLLATAKKAVAAKRYQNAVRLLQHALGLWRGPILSGAGSPVITAAAMAHQERRLTAAEDLIGLRLSLGEASELVPEARQLVQEHPLRETLRAQLMIALYQSGRQAEALEEYGRVRELLAEELGVDPGRRLTEVYEGILHERGGLTSSLAHLLPGPADTGAVAPTGAAPEPVAPASAEPAPAEPPRAEPAPAEPQYGEAPSTLPYDLADFSGRDRELRELLALGTEGAGRHTRVVALDGMGGCGKTSLAVHAAHRLASEYTDGQFYLDLRGYTPGEQAVSASAAIDSLLRAIGVPGEAIPEDLPGRTALWQSTVVGRRLLLLLDNASDTADIRPLLPTSSGSLVLITSRARLVDLDSAEWISLDVMSPNECAALLRETLGTHRVTAEPEAALALVHLCGHLPLALRIATARLRNRPRWTLQYLVDRLRDETRRLDELSLGERSVAATLRLSYQALDQTSRTSFRILALHPHGDIDVHTAAALLGVEPRHAESILETLLDVHLMQQPEVGLYHFHDLLRSFAQSLRCQATAEEDRTAVRRLLDYYLSATEKACTVLFPGRRIIPTGVATSSVVLPALADPVQAEQWLAREQAALQAAILLAERLGHHLHAICLARNLCFQLSAGGQLEEFRAIAHVAVDAARQLGDAELLGVCLSNLGVACWKLGQFAEGVTIARHGLDVAQQLGDRETVAHSESTLGQLHSLLGWFPEALAHLERAVEHQRTLGALRAEAESLTLLSTLYEQWGRHTEAASAARRAIRISVELGQQENELAALTDLAFAQTWLADIHAADESLDRARALCDGTRDPGHVALVFALSAEVRHRLGDPVQAARHADRALALLGAKVSALRIAKVRNTIGRYMRKRGDSATALTLHTGAWHTARPLGFRVEEAYALSGMAAALTELGRPREAIGHELAAEELFAQMGVHRDSRRS